MAKNMLYYVKRKVVHMNNLKNIREIYGITQEEIAKAIMLIVQQFLTGKIKKIKRPLVLA